MWVIETQSEKMLRWLETHLLLMLGLLTLARLGFLWINGVGLTGDEAYYWDWSRRPDWCYFSKPPMVAWLIGAFTWVFGDYTATVRLPAVVLGTVFLCFFHATAQAFYGRRAAVLALILLLATPNNVLSNLIMTIDPPLYCFWMISLYYLQRALFYQDSRAWFWAGCAAAAALLSKQVALALPLMLLLFILLDKSRYCWLKREFWLFCLPIIVAMMPILLWNAQHEWAMFDHSKEHFTTQISASVLSVLEHVLALCRDQLLLMSPIIFILSVVLSVHCVFKFKQLSAEAQFLTLMGPVLLLGVLLLAFLQKVQGNWPMPFYITGLILLAGFWVEGRWRAWCKSAVLLGYLLVAVTYLLPVLLRVFDLQNTKIDPIRRFNYWQEWVENVYFERQIALPTLEHSFVVTLGHRNMASQLAFYLPDHPQVFRYETKGEVTTQYELWPGPVQFMGASALIVSEAPGHMPDKLVQAFQKFRFLAEIPSTDPKHPDRPYFVYLGENLQHWPTLAEQAFAEEKL